MKRPSQYNFPHEVFKTLNNIDSFHDKVNYLQNNATFAIKTILQCAFSPNIILDLPEGNPPFIKHGLPPENSLGRIDSSIKILGYLVVDPVGARSVGLERMRKETKFIQLLESVHETDAEIILAMKNKKLESLYPVMTHALALAAFPTLIPPLL